MKNTCLIITKDTWADPEYYERKSQSWRKSMRKFVSQSVVGNATGPANETACPLSMGPSCCILLLLLIIWCNNWTCSENYWKFSLRAFPRCYNLARLICANLLARVIFRLVRLLGAPCPEYININNNSWVRQRIACRLPSLPSFSAKYHHWVGGMQMKWKS